MTEHLGHDKNQVSLERDLLNHLFTIGDLLTIGDLTFNYAPTYN